MEKLRGQIADMKKSLFDEGLLNDQFEEIEKLQDSDDPRFAEDIFTVFFNESSTRIASIETGIEDTSQNFTMLQDALSKLHSSSCQIGAKNVYTAVNHATGYLGEGNIEDVEGFKEACQKIKPELDTLQARIKPYFELSKQQNGN
ncbi:hypothetical protein ACFE04_019230 [Oxalis oulophora]